MNICGVFLKFFLYACFCILTLQPLFSQDPGQVITAPDGARYTYHLIGDLEAANPRNIIPAGQGTCGTPGWISYAITHQLAVNPQMMVAAHQITGAKDLCAIMSAITMGCGYYLYCPDGNKDLKFIGENVAYRMMINTDKKEIYIGEFFNGNLVEINKCYVGRKWFEEDPEPYENPVVYRNPTCDTPPPEVRKIDPVAIIIANPTAGEEPLRVSFNGSKSYDPDGGKIEKYIWDFGETVLYGEMVSFTFTMADTFQVFLTVTDDEGDSHSTKTQIIVNPPLIDSKPPVARIIASPVAGTAPFEVKLDGFSSYDPDGGELVKYEWEINNIAFSEISEPLPYTLEKPGEYTFTLTVTDDEGDTNSTIQKVMVFAPEAPKTADSCWMMSYVIRNCGETPDTVQRTPIRVACPAPPQDQVIIADCCCDGVVVPNEEKKLPFELSGGVIFNRHRGQLPEYGLGGNIQIRYRFGEKNRMALLIDGSIFPAKRATPMDDRPYKWSTLRDSIDPSTNMPLVWWRGTSRGTANLGVGFEIMPLPWLYTQVIGSVERTFLQEEISDPRKHPLNEYVGFDLETYFLNTRVGVRSEHLEIYIGFRALQENRPFVLIEENPQGGSHHPGWDKAYEVGVSIYY